MQLATWNYGVQAECTSRVAEIVLPSCTAGWVVVGRAAHGRDRQLLSSALPSLHGASLATLTIDLPPSHRTAAAWLELAVAHLRRDLAEGLPIAFLGAGGSAGAAWTAAAAGGLDGVMALNGRPGTTWARLDRVRTPSLLVVEHRAHDLPWELLVARTLSWRLGGAAVELVTGRRPLDAAVLARWYFDHLLSPTPTPTLAQPRSASLRGRAVRLGVTAALLAPRWRWSERSRRAPGRRCRASPTPRGCPLTRSVAIRRAPASGGAP